VGEVTRRYVTPLAFKQALEARLRVESEWRRVPLQRLRQLVVFDRMLVRLFATLGDSVILKGGVLLELRLDRARATKDIDLRMVVGCTVGSLHNSDYPIGRMCRESGLTRLAEPLRMSSSQRWDRCRREDRAVALS
jgi:hypothetical protein